LVKYKEEQTEEKNYEFAMEFHFFRINMSAGQDAAIDCLLA
jgi:hypothetical protein